MKEKEICAIFDLDGVIFDSREWGKYAPKEKDDREGWDYFAKHADVCKPNLSKINLVKDLSKVLNIIFITSREGSPFLKKATKDQLKKCLGNTKYTLCMRPYKDYRTSVEVKKEILEKNVLPKYDPILAVDDDLENINMFKSFNIPTHHYTLLRDENANR